MFSDLANGESYTKLDLTRAYKQMKVKPECQPLLTINTHRGLYRYTRLPFGITTAPSLWQRAMAQVLSGIPNVAYYIDDILITGCTRAEHIENLWMVLCRLREYGLKLKYSKCEFFAKDLEFLGHRISPEGVRPTAERIAGIRDAPTPTNKQELQSFLGMLTYNAKFLPNVSHTLYPLNQLLQQNVSWAWKSEHQKAFDAAKQMLSSDRALAHYDVNRPVILFCDASAYGLGACLVHIMDDGSQRPIAYASCALSKPERVYAQIEREGLALVFGVRRFHQHLYSRPFTLLTDHRPLGKIFGSKQGIPPMAAARIQRWALTLSTYQYTIEHINGKANNCADCMSRLPLSGQVRDSAEKIHVVVQMDDMPVTATQIAKESKCDKELSIVLKSIQHGHWPSDTTIDLSPFRKRYTELSVLDGCILWGSRVVIPSVFRQSLLQELHITHLGMSRMKSLARSYVWWPGLDSQIEEVCRHCVECCAANRIPPKVPAHPWMIPQFPWQRVHVDHAYFGRHLLLVVVDAYSKWPEVYIVSSTSAQQTIDKLRQIFACHGLPATLVSDNGSPFQSTEFQQFAAANGIPHRRVPPYHPASNGLAENMVKTVKHALSKAKITKDVTLDTLIARFLATYRNTQHTTTSRTSAELLLNRMPRTCLSLVHPCTSQQLEQAAETQVGEKQPRKFAVNDNVMVHDLRPNATDKWRKGIVTKVLGPLNYKVTVDGHSRQAHVEHLLPGTSNVDVDSSTPEQADQEQEEHDTTTTANNTIVPLVPVEVESNAHNDSQGREIVRPRSTRNRHPPARLIEEMN